MKLKIHHSRPSISNSEIAAVSSVLKSANLASGKVNAEFERRFAATLKINSAVAVNSGTSALHLALLALQIKPGDKIILPSFVCASVLNAVLYVAARPQLADIEPDSFNLSPEDAKKKISGKTRAIILPHMFGHPADIQKFLELDVPLIENCAQSLGARYRGKPVGGFGDISIFSFYATKMIAAGYGGMIASKNRDLMCKVRDLIEVDEREDYKLRFNYKMSDIAASLGLAQLKRLNSFIAQRRAIAKIYQQNLKREGIQLPGDEEKNHIYFRYVVRIEGKINKVINGLNKKGIETKRPVFKPLHRYLGLNSSEFPNTEAAYNSAVSLPIYPSLKKSQAKFIVDSLNRQL